MSFNARVFGSDLDHVMTNYHLRQSPPPAGQRRNTAASDNIGFALDTSLTDDRGAWRIGVDGFTSSNDSNIDNPNNPTFFVVNFNDAQRETLGVYVERSHRFNDDWRGEFGLRHNRVETDADEVDATPARMMPPAMALRDAFNSADREQTDNNTDLVAQAWYRASDGVDLYAGLARKHRAPSHVERYLWLGCACPRCLSWGAGDGAGA